MAKWGRRHRGANLPRLIVWFLATIGALSLLFAFANLSTLRGVYTINNVLKGVSWADVTVQLNQTALRERRLTPDEARTRLQSGLRYLGLPAKVRLSR